MAPAKGGAPDIPRDAGQRVVIGCRTRISTGLALGFAGLIRLLFLPDILTAVLPYTIGHVVERRLLRLRARPAFGQIRPDLGVRHRNFPVVVGSPVGDIECERRPVDVNVEPLAMARCGGIDGFTRRPRVGQQERPVHGQPLGGGNSEGIAVIEADIAVPVADFVVMERYGPPILGPCRYQDTWLRTGLAPLNLEVVHRDHGAVEQLLLPVGGADTQAIAARDLERRSAVRSSSVPRLTITVTRSVSGRSPSVSAANRRSRIRCDSARTSARVRASTTLDLSGCSRW